MTQPITRIVLIVLDGCGVGALPDAARYGDTSAFTLQHALHARPGLTLPALAKLGLGQLVSSPALQAESAPSASIGRMLEASQGKDTATGHWEIMGVITETPFITFPNGFPTEMINEFSRRIGRGVLGNKPASGTEIILELGELHQQTGDVIVYTSADSVFQIAAHEETVPLDELYHICEVAYQLVTPAGVARVIARPFTGLLGHYRRTENRHDYTVPPPSPTVMQHLVEAGIPVTGIGKIRDIYAGIGVSEHRKATNNQAISQCTIDAVKEGTRGLIFANLVDFDMLYGHRRDAVGFANALEAFDAKLPELQAFMKPGDLLILTADHGNDPIHPGTDHTREFVPLVVWNPARALGSSLGDRQSFADIGATIAEAFGINAPTAGTSFLHEVV